LKILILGGTRYLGPRLVKRLVESGHEPVLFNRGQTNAPLPVSAPVKEIHGDRNLGTDLADAVADGSFDAVVDTLAFDGPGAERAVQVFSGKVKRYLAISSVACYGRLQVVPADESHPYVTDDRAFPPKANPYATGKRDVEKVLFKAHKDHGFPAVIVRPSVSYGYGRLFSIWGYCNRHVARIRAGKPVIVPDSGEGLIQPVFIDDEAEIVERALTADNVIGEAFNCAGPVAVPLWQYFRAHGEAMDKRVDLVELPASYLAGFDPVLCVRASENLIYNHAYDVSKLERVLGFRHRYSLVDGLSHTIEFQDRWGLAQETGGRDPDDWLIDGFEKGGASSMDELGRRVRDEASYRPPTKPPLVRWAPEDYTDSC
jgi:nucleoside-diphosphate-sugar epimerase